MQHAFPITETAVLLQCIPQRNPFVMVDCLYLHTPNQVVAGITIKNNTLFVKNYELKEPGLIEHMAQTVALHTGFGFYIQQEQAPVGYIGSISNLEILELPKLNDVIQTTATIIQEFAGITLVEIESKINEVCIAKAQMKTVIAST